jgi:hypothetical protein
MLLGIDTTHIHRRTRPPRGAIMISSWRFARGFARAATFLSAHLPSGSSGSAKKKARRASRAFFMSEAA